jgi:hypothetical protein
MGERYAVVYVVSFGEGKRVKKGAGLGQSIRRAGQSE